jgi:signal transduction histidine kinase
MKRDPSPENQSDVEPATRREYSPLSEERRLQIDPMEFLDLLDEEFVDENKPSIFTGKTDTGTTVTPKIYQDKHGLPVTYDAATQEQQKKAKSDSLSMLWHELLSPLTVIKGYTSTLLQLNDAITEEQKIKYIQGIESASNKMIRFMENLRDITRLEEPDSLLTQRIALPDLLRTIIHDMQDQTTKHVFKIRPSERLPLISADPEKIEQVICNLLINAVKYSPHEGDIEAEIRMVRSEQELKRMFGSTRLMKLPCIIVSISDSGIGIPEGELERIFGRFYRVKNKLTNATQGAGLGLYICKIIIEAHGGYIWARNKLQGGSIFSFSLPADR